MPLVVRYSRKLKKRGVYMALNVFILIVGLVLLALSAISDAAALLEWLYEQDRKHKHKGGIKAENDN